MATPAVMRQLAENIAKRRKELGLTQAQVAEIISMEKETLSRMEAGKITPSLDRLEKIAAALECPIADLFRDTSPDTQAQAKMIAELIRPLPQEEQKAIVRFVRDAVRLFSDRACG
jgi:transcriptional regulator with XRE-family HTH domain